MLLAGTWIPGKGNWAVAIIVMFVLILCMEILARFAIPIPGYNFKEKKCT